MTEKRFKIAESNLTDGYCVFDREKKYAFTPRPRKADCLNDAHTLNELHEEKNYLERKKCEYWNKFNLAHLDNINLRKENEQLKQFISKIDFAIIRKYDNSLENLLDEVYDGEYENWIKKQVSRAKKLDGDVE